MARTGRPKKQQLVLSEEERSALERLAARPRSGRQLAFRAKIILRCARGGTDTDIAGELRASRLTVGKWRVRFIERRLDGLSDEPRPGAPRSIGDDEVESVITKTLESTPRGRTHWSTRSMAKSVGLSHSTIGRMWRAFGLQPHRSESFQLSKDPLLVEKVRDIVGLYLNPPDRAVVLCVDEKAQIQALERAQPILPMDIGQPERRTHDYIRHGTTDLFAALDAATGKVIGRMHARHRAREFKSFLNEIDMATPKELDVHVVLDNLSTHKTPEIMRWLARHPRFHLHFTPTKGSWLNLVERFFGLLTEHALRRGSHNSSRQLRAAIQEYLDAHNEAPKPFKWTKTADEILASIARFATRTTRAHPTLPANH
jgi:transposase